MVNNDDFLNEIRKITGSGNFNLTPKLPTPVANNNINPTYNVGATGGGGGGDIDRLVKAIRQQESSNNYKAVNKMSGALGGYQIMPSNLAGWSREALGRSVSQQEFMGNSSIQDAIARYKLSQYLAKYGAAGAAVAWYGGPGAVKNMDSTRTQAGGYPSLRAYWEAILRRMG